MFWGKFLFWHLNLEFSKLPFWCLSGWRFQPTWKIGSSNWIISPKTKNVWKHQLVMVWSHEISRWFLEEFGRCGRWKWPSSWKFWGWHRDPLSFPKIMYKHIHTITALVIVHPRLNKTARVQSRKHLFQITVWNRFFLTLKKFHEWGQHIQKKKTTKLSTECFCPSCWWQTLTNPHQNYPHQT